jgi:hypothetical protein
MTRALRAVWATLVYIFVALIPVQFYLAGHGAFEGAHGSDKKVVPMTTAWDPHLALGDLLVLISLIILLLAFAARLPRRLLFLPGALFVFMVIQFALAQANGSASARGFAALHAVNALVVTMLAVWMAFRARVYIPMARFQQAAAVGTDAPA